MLQFGLFCGLEIVSPLPLLSLYILDSGCFKFELLVGAIFFESFTLEFWLNLLPEIFSRTFFHVVDLELQLTTF